MAALNFNAETVPPAGGYELLPAGKYLVLIEDSEIKPTKAGNGMILELKHNILEGPYAGRKLFRRINIQNINPKVQDIGQGELSQLCHATGKLQVQDSAELHMIPLIARVTIQKDKNGQYEDRNEIREYQPAGSTTGGGHAPAVSTRPAFQAPPPAQAQSAAPPPAQAAAAPGARPPWMKG